MHAAWIKLAAATPYPRRPALPRPAAALAHYLPPCSKRVAVLEARTRGSGQSGKNSGMLMQWNNDFYTNLAALLGKAQLL